MHGLTIGRPRRHYLMAGSFDAGTHNYSNRRILVAELTDTIPFPSD